MKRPDGMSFNEYKQQRKEKNDYLKFYLKGARIWNSLTQKTYKKATHGPIGKDNITETHQDPKSTDIQE